jgi:hypothetical protein
MTNIACRQWLSFFSAIVIQLFDGSIASAADPSDDIDTNRPSFMFSPIVLPKGSLQLENGCLDSGLRRGRLGFDLPETQVRIGLARSTEFQVFVPNYVLSKSGGEFCSGVTDLSEIGIKQQLPTPGKLKAAIIASVSAPTGARRLSLGGTSGILRLPYTSMLSMTAGVLVACSRCYLLTTAMQRAVASQMFCFRAVSATKACAFLEYGGSFTSQ